MSEPVFSEINQNKNKFDVDSAEHFSRKADYEKLKVLASTYLHRNKTINDEYIKANYYLAKSYFNSDYKKVVEITDRSIQLISELNISLDWLDKFYSLQVMMYRKKGLYDSAIYLGHHILNNRNCSDSIKFSIYINIGISFRKLDYLDSSLIYGEKSENIALELNNLNMLHSALQSRANTYSANKDYLEAFKIEKRLLRISRSLNNKEFLANDLLNIGSSFTDLKQLDSAVFYLTEAMEVSVQANNKETVSIIRINLANVLIELKKYQEALEIINKCIEDTNFNNQKLANARAYYIKAEILFILKYFKNAEKHSLIALDIATRNSYKLDRSINLEILSQIYEAMDKKSLALDFLRQYHLLKDSMNNETKLKEIRKLQTKYETQKKQIEIDQLTHENDVQKLKISKTKLWLLISLATIITLTLLAFVIYFLFKQRLVKKQKEAENLRQKLLRIQLNPHFTYNSLSAIQSLIYQEGKKQKAADYLAAFSSLMRNILELNQHNFITLDEEIIFIENYLMIQQIRFDDTLHFSIITDPVLDLENTLIPPMITQPFLENSLEHGFPDKSKKSNLEIHLSKKEDILEIRIIDDGVGRNASKELNIEKKHESLATKITQERLLTMNKTIRKRASMTINDLTYMNKPIGTEVIFKLPLIYG